MVTCRFCNRQVYGRGLCKPCYERHRKQGRLSEFTTKERPALERYEEKVDRSLIGGCHPWTGSLDEHGYGFFRVGHKMVRAHRWAYQELIEPLQPNEVVRHYCDNPSCQNPWHWIKGSVQDNVDDMIRRGRAPSHVGAKNPKAKLTEAQVLEIRSSTLPRQMLANMYGVNWNSIDMIQKHKTWIHI